MEQGSFCPHCGARQRSSAKTCLNCGKNINEEPKSKNATRLMKNIGKVRLITFLIMILIGVLAFIVEQFSKPLGKWGDIITIIGFVFFGIFIVFFIILMFLGNKNYEDSSEELSEYKKKHTNTFFK